MGTQSLFDMSQAQPIQAAQPLFDMSKAQPISPPQKPPLGSAAAPTAQPVPASVPDMAQVPGAVPGTPSPTQARKPTELLDVAAAYPGALPTKVPKNWTGKPVEVPPLDIPRAIAGTAADVLLPGTIMPGQLGPSPGEPIGQATRELLTSGERTTGALRMGAGVAEGLAPLAGPMAVENPGTFIRAAGEGYLGGKAAKYGTKAVGGTEEQQTLAEDIGQMAPILAHAMLHPEFTQGHTEAGHPAAEASVRGMGAGIEVTPDEFVIRGGSKENPKELRIPRRPQSPKPAAVEPPTIEGEQVKPVHHASNDIEDLRTSAEKQAPKVGDAVAKAVEPVPGAKVEAVRDSKDSDRIADKAERQGVQPSQIGDIAGAKVSVPDKTAANQVLDNLHKELPVESANGTVTGEPQNNAVRQTQAIVDTKAPAGEPLRKAEVMIQTPEMAKVTESTHDDYRKAQELRAQGKEAEAQAIEAKIVGEHEKAEQAARARQEKSNESVPERGATALHGSPQEAAREEGRQPERVGGRDRLQETPAQGARPAPQEEKVSASGAPIPPSSRAVPGSNDLGNLRGQRVEVRDPQTGAWKAGEVYIDRTIPNWTGGQSIRRVRGVFDDGSRFNNVEIKDVRKVQGKAKEGFDFDGTLFKENPDGSIGEPIPERIASLKQRVANGERPIIESHRATSPERIKEIQDALESVGLPRLQVTAKKNAAPELIDDKQGKTPGVKVERVPTNADTPLPPIPSQYGPPKKDFGGKVPEEKLGFKPYEPEGPVQDMGEKARADVERRMGGPLPRGQEERRIADVAKPERDTNVMARLEKEHPEWSLSRRLQEAAAITNPAGGKSLEGQREKAQSVAPATGNEAATAGKTGAVLENKTAGAAGEAPPVHKYGNTQANIPTGSEAAKALETARSRISDSDLMGQGKNIEGNHVTVRYGIKNQDVGKIKEFLAQQKPFEAKLGKTEKFPPSESSDGAAVIMAPIEAPGLHRLNSEIEKHGDFAESNFKEFRPHATVAYVDPAKADRYVGMDVTNGKKFTIDQVAINHKDGTTEMVKLGGKKPVAEESKPAKDESTKAEQVFAGDLNKKVSGLRKQIKELEKETSAPAAYYQDSAKNASERLKRSARIQQLSELRSELREIEQAHKYDLAEKLTPPEVVTQDGRNFEGRYVRAALEPVKAAWLDKWKPGEGEDVDEHWKWLVKTAKDSSDKPADFSKGHLFIKVPDDGSFYIPNTPAAIDHALKAAGKFDDKIATSLPKVGAKKFRMTSPKEFDNAKYIAGLEKEIKDLESEQHSVGDMQRPYVLEQLKAARENLAEAKQQTPESLLSGESGSFTPSKLGEAATQATGAIGDYLRNAKHATDLARDLQRGLETLDTQKQSDILRGKQTMEELKLPHVDDEAMYHYLENPDLELTPAQDKILDSVILPIQEQNTALYQELRENGIPLENYVHRVVKGKGGMLDRIAQGVKGVGTKGTLSKSAPQTKQRTYMALEDRDGNRMVVSVKGGQVTGWNNGTPENLGGLNKSVDGSTFDDKNGKTWTLQQATTKEIEANTETKYYHSALASSIASNIQLNSAVRAMRFLDSFKASPEFKEIAFDTKTRGNPPEGWRATNLPQFAGYAFEPRTSEVLDHYYDRMRQGNIGVLDQVGKFMRLTMLLNPIMHPMNVAASWAMERGATGTFMTPFDRGAWRAGNRAVKAVLAKNNDFIEALDAGAALQSHQPLLQDINRLFFEHLADAAERKETWATKMIDAVGLRGTNALTAYPRLVHQIAFGTGDVLYLQSAYQYQYDHPGVSLADALKESGRINPEYRVPTRIADSALLSKAMTNKWATIFGPYHYSLLKSFAEVGKSALGAQGPSPGRTKAQEVAKGWDRLALLGLVTMALYPALDQLAKTLTGDKHAKVRRSGPFALIDAASQVATHQQSVSTAAQRVVTPAPQTKAAAELLMNREFYAGHQLYDPHADYTTQAHQIGRFLMGELGMVGQVERAKEGTSEQRKRFLLQQVGIQMAKTRAEKTAADIAMSKVGTEAESPEDQRNRVQRREILEQMRKGNTKPFEEARENRQLSHRQVLDMERRARLTPLEDTVHGFSIAEVQKVLEAAKADNNQEEVKQLERVLRQKRARARSFYESSAVQ